MWRMKSRVKFSIMKSESKIISFNNLISSRVCMCCIFFGRFVLCDGRQEGQPAKAHIRVESREYRARVRANYYRNVALVSVAHC